MSIRHVLVVGGARDVTRVMKRVRSAVVITTMVSVPRLAKIRYPDNCARVLALQESSATDEWVSLATTVHEREPIHAVAAFGEFDQHRAAAIAAALGLRFHSPEVIGLIYDKAAMRERLRATGIEEVPSAHVRTRSELCRFAGVHGFPLILKPRCGTGSAGIVKVSDAADLARARPSGDCVVEPFLPGVEIAVEAFSEGGVHRVVGITRKLVDDNFVELGHEVGAATEADSKVAGYVAGVLDSVGLAYGPSHTELILTAAGPRVVETHSRAGGDQIPQLLHAATGIDLIELAVRQVLGERVLPALDAELSAPDRGSWAGAIRYAVPPASRSLVSVGNLAEARALPWVTGCTVLKEPGQRLTAPIRSSVDRVAFCTAVAPDAETATAAAARAVDTLTIVVSEE
ncbi:ATP-grasp domain-containing protein [Amycolatopsis cihanbeyliensis]|uniref:Biotin carboxylase n=1 Tax=Amycolatopsis cihanbeyliensis TaxID=1128664 RepID=A0A542DDB4_AMYCI|nr:ATP-grasp domain-containing protein [Amycolatopsis cihanbeyliensis]TQJ01064.1 biotin carboxylase [Amycolatopsis cihanbeyliensis]